VTSDTLESTQREIAKAKRRTSIIDATKSLLRTPDKPFSSSTIAEKAGVSVATLYNLIGRREALIGSIMNEMLVELGDRIANLDEEDPILRAQAVVTISIEMFVEDPDVYREVIHFLSGSLSQQVADHVTFSAVDLQISAMQEAQDKGQLEDWVDPEAAGQQILTSYSGAMFYWSANGDDDLFLKQALYGFWTAIAAYGTVKEKKRAIKQLGDLS